jgi:NAD(P) transhydrogenase
MGMTGAGDRSYDLVVIGGGPAGEKGAAQAAYFGKRVAMVEAGHLGGATGNTGTLPSKTLRETALYLSGMRSRGLYGIDYSFSRAISANDLLYRKDLVVASHRELVHENLDRHGITLIPGRGELLDATSVLVHGADGETTISGAYVLIATGSRPAAPSWLPQAPGIYDSDSILTLSTLPGTLIVAGAGVIGCEYATTFAALGTRVHLVDGGERLLPFLDAELSDVLASQMMAHGVDILFQRRLESVDASDGAVRAELDDGTRISADALLFCGGRRGNTDGLGLERAGVAVDDRGRIVVDRRYATSVPTVFAAGDVIGFPALASTSMEQGRVAVCHAFGFAYKQQVSTLIPYGLYTIPEISMVGASEDELRNEGRPFVAGRGYFSRNARAQIGGETSGMIKVLVAPDTRRILGVHIVGDRASELVHIGQQAMQLDGTIDVFIDDVFNFPTLAETYKYAAYDALQALGDHSAPAQA